MRDDLRRHTVNEPLAALAAKDAEIAALRAEVAKLRARLEVDHYFTAIEGSGELVRVEVGPEDNLPDGIACRDATIELLEEEIASLRAESGQWRALTQKLDRRIHRQRERLAWFERWADQGYGLDHRLRRLWQDLASKRGRQVQRLTASIKDTVEGRYERVGVMEAEDAPVLVCAHGLPHNARCDSCLRAHLLDLIASEADHG